MENTERFTQEETMREKVITEPIGKESARRFSKSMKVEPSDFFEIEYFLDYPPPVGRMTMTLHTAPGGKKFSNRR